jgi:hypothetical protein
MTLLLVPLQLPLGQLVVGWMPLEWHPWGLFAWGYPTAQAIRWVEAPYWGWLMEGMGAGVGKGAG